MTDSERQCLNVLLSSTTDELVVRCLRATMDPQAIVRLHIGTMPGEHAWSIYSLRGELNARGSKTIEGYNTLLPALKAEADAGRAVSANFLITASQWFVLFTDSEQMRLIGILTERSGRLFRSAQNG